MRSSTPLSTRARRYRSDGKRKALIFRTGSRQTSLILISGNIVQREQMEKGASAPVTTGSLYRPIQAGRLVEGGQREEMKRQDQQRRLAAPTEGPGSQ